MSAPADVDAIVVGGGLAGLAATAALSASGMRVMLLEKQARPGGSSAMSGGWFALSGTPLQRRYGVDDSDDAFLADMVRSGGGFADVSLLRRLIERQGRAIEIIDRAGAWTDELKVSAGMSLARAHLVRIDALLAHLGLEADAHGAVFERSRPALALTTRDGRVTGVRTAAGDIGARHGVVLASGGFSRSRDLLELFVPEQAGAMPYGGAGNTGDGLRMAWALGAGLADVAHVAGTYGQHADTTDDEHELLTATYLGAILVGADGTRFTDESASYKDLGRAVLTLSDGMAFQVFDAVVRARSKPGVPLSDIDRIDQLGHLVSAPSLGELERMLRLPPRSLQETVAHYNAAVAGEHDDPFGRSGLVNGVGDLEPVARPPFFAYPAVTAMTSTYGGVTVDPDTAVRRIDGTRIAGLYAAGEVVGGFHGASYMTGTALTKALVFGVEAATAITG